MKKLLLTGAGGFVGARIALLMKDRYQLVTFPRGLLARAPMQEIFDFVMEAKPDAIIHTAAIADMGECEKDPAASCRANVELTECLCRAAQALGAKIVCYSSDQVYNGCDPADGPYREDTPLQPVNVYGRHKLEAEQRGLAACPSAVMLRATWMYDLPGDGLPIRGNLLCNLLAQAQENRAETFFTNDLRGVTWVRQAAELTEQALLLPGGAYNFGSPNDVGMLETARCALRAMGLDQELAQPAAAPRPRCLAMDPGRLRSFGLVFDDTKDGFERCVQAFGGCKAVKNGL